ncbi:MAG: tRNA (Guanine37-N1) -methyltransferase [Myxococcales bacterium]|nr:tRNA (Guanine37-N1) -methyltransferase [Myxococcales bacterium]
MIFEVVTLFPEMFSSVTGASIIGKAQEKGALQVYLTDPRSFTTDKHHSVDDTPYGGGAGMVMRPDPLVAAIEAIELARGPAHKILLTPTGASLTQPTVLRLAKVPRLMLVCGRYEGMDERVRGFCDEELSIGDYVLTGGELAAMVVIDAVARRLPGVLGNADSAVDESFEAGLLEHPQYTRPALFRGAAVPEALLSGNHARIRRWRRLQSLERTRDRRPDLFAQLALTAEDRAMLDGEEP